MKKKQAPPSPEKTAKALFDNPDVTAGLLRRFGVLFDRAKHWGWSFPELNAAAKQAFGKGLFAFSDEEIDHFRRIIEARGRRREQHE